MGDYKKDGDALKFSSSPSDGAVAWQGYDDFVGIDTYQKEVLEKGTVLVKMEPSSSGYFTTLDEYEKYNKDSKKLSEAMQLQPWFDSENDRFLYRSTASFWVLKEDVEVAVGNTSANQDYGKGGIKQVFVAGFDLKDLSKHKTDSFLEKKEEVEELSNYHLTQFEGETITAKHSQHVLKRNYFCALRQKERLLDLSKTTSSPAVKKECLKRIHRLTKECRRLEYKILKSVDRLNGILNSSKENDNSVKMINTILGTSEENNNSVDKPGLVPSSTYDEKMKNLFYKIEDIEKGKDIKQFSEKDEKAVDKLNHSIMGKVTEEIKLVLGGKGKDRINIDDLRLTYSNYLFMAHEKNMQSLVKNKKELADVFREKFRLNSKVEKNTRSLSVAKQHLNVVAGYGKIVAKYEKKVFSKDKFYKKHCSEIEQYKKSKQFLETHKITDLAEYKSRIEKDNSRIKKSINELEHKSTNLLRDKNGIEKRLMKVKANTTAFQKLQKQIHSSAKTVKSASVTNTRSKGMGM